MDNRLTIPLPPRWVNSAEFEQALGAAGSPHESHAGHVGFFFPAGCKVLIDVAVRLLSLANQLDAAAKQVRLTFEEGESGVQGYLNRMGFFDCLAEGIQVRPRRPKVSGARVYRGANEGLVEIARINENSRYEDLPAKMADVVSHACRAREDVSGLVGAAWTIFAELIDNVFSHSRTRLALSKNGWVQAAWGLTFRKSSLPAMRKKAMSMVSNRL